MKGGTPFQAVDAHRQRRPRGKETFTTLFRRFGFAPVAAATALGFDGFCISAMQAGGSRGSSRLDPAGCRGALACGGRRAR